jgi:ATP:corrinoid adenosyltransferase
MPSTPISLGELFRSLDLTLTVRALPEDEESWACTLTRPDGRTYEIDAVSFFDVDPDTGDEWAVEPAPSRVLSVLAGGDVDEDESEGEPDADDAAAAAETVAAVRAFLGDEAYDLLVALDEASLE